MHRKRPKRQPFFLSERIPRSHLCAKTLPDLSGGGPARLVVRVGGSAVEAGVVDAAAVGEDPVHVVAAGQASGAPGDGRG